MTEEESVEDQDDPNWELNQLYRFLVGAIVCARPESIHFGLSLRNLVAAPFDTGADIERRVNSDSAG